MWKRVREWWLSRARAAPVETPAAPDPPAPDPELIGKFARQANDLDAIRKSVEDAASVSAGLWLSYLFVLFYIGIAAGAVTHRDLLLENAVKLPFLNVELPLVAFFFLAPILFIVSHAYTLVHFVMLAAKVGVLHDELIKQLPDTSPGAPDTREGLRRQLSSNIFVQFLAGPEDIREGGLGLILKLIAWITLVIGPVLLLLLIQVQFLPYHLEWLTWVHRCAVLLDLIIVWALWTAVLESRSEIKWPRHRRRHYVLTPASLVAAGLAFTAATYPGEWLDEHVGNKQWIPPNGVTAWLGAMDQDNEPTWTSFHDLLFNGEYDEKSQRRKSIFSNTLVLPGFDGLEAAKIDDPKKLDTIQHTLILRGRHLESAVFYGADLRKAILENAYLQGASLYQAKLRGAWFYNAKLQGASLFQAQLQGASLESAQLQGASLEGAQLQGAWAREAQLQGVLLNGAQLQGASLEHGRLQGALLNGAQLQGVLLSLADLQGASLFSAKLQGATLSLAHLQGAALQLADFRGASLQDADLQGASLAGAKLQGADFNHSTLAGTDMSAAEVWRATFEDAKLTAVFEDGLKESAISKAEFAALQAMITKEVPDGEEREKALKSIGKLTADISGDETRARETLEKGRVDAAAYRSALADQLQGLACSRDESALHIARGLIANGRIKDTGAQAPALVESILKPDCPVSAALTEADKAALKKIAKEASSAH